MKDDLKVLDGADTSGEAEPFEEEGAAPEGSGGGSGGEDPRIEDLEDRLLRLRAEFDNYRKRVARELDQEKAKVAAEQAGAFLPLADALEEAARQPVSPEAKAYQEGIRGILKQLRTILGNLGVEEIPAAEEAFDPEVHEALGVVEDPVAAEGTVAEVMQKGYRLGNRLLRPARVRVVRSRKPGAAEGDEA